MKCLQTLIVERPYAELIWKGQAKLVISPQKLPSACDLAFADSKQQYGVVSLGKGKPVAISEFRRLQNHHLIPDTERVAMWPKARRLYAHSVVFKEFFSEPKLWPGPPPLIETRYRRELSKAEREDKRLVSHLRDVFTMVDLFKCRISGFVEQQLRLTKQSDTVSLLLNSMITLARDLYKEYANALGYEGTHRTIIDEDLPETLDLADNLWAVLKDASPLLPTNSRIGELTSDGIEMLEDFIKFTAHLKEDKDVAEGLTTPRATKPSDTSECNTEQEEAITDEKGAIYKESDPFKDEVTVCKSFLYIIDKQDTQDETDRTHIAFGLEHSAIHDVKTRVTKQLASTNEGNIVVHPDTALVENTLPIYDLILRKREDYQAFVALQDNGVTDFMTPTKDDPYLQKPPKEKPLKSALQFHSRGRAAHLDFRIKVDNYLIGYTLAGSIAGRIPKFLDLDEAKQLADRFDMKGSRWNKAFSSPKKIYATLKAVHPISWLNINAEAFEPGSVGGSKYHAGYMVKIASPSVTWGVHTKSYHEYFLEDDKHFQGVLIFRKLESQAADMPQGEEGKASNTFWVASIKQTLVPYIVSNKTLNKNIELPRNWSFLPPMLKSVVPKRFQYWNPADEDERKEMRKELIRENFFTPETVKFVSGKIRRVVPKYHLYNPDPLRESQTKGSNIYNVQHHGPPTDREDTESKTDSQEKNEQRGKKTKPEPRLIKGAVCDVRGEGSNRMYLYGVGPVKKDQWDNVVTLQKSNIQAHFIPVNWVKANDISAEIGDVLHVHVDTFICTLDKVKRITAVGQETIGVTKQYTENSLTVIPTTDLEQLKNLLLPQEIRKSHTDAVEAHARNLVSTTKQVRLLKYETRDATQEGEEEERFVLGEVLIPDEDDSQEDTYDAETVRRAAHYFMEYSPIIGLNHERALSRAKVRVLESYVAPIDMNIEGRFVKQGTWLLGARIVDDDLWESVKAGTFTGWSIEGTAIAEEIA